MAKSTGKTKLEIPSTKSPAIKKEAVAKPQPLTPSVIKEVMIQKGITYDEAKAYLEANR